MLYNKNKYRKANDKKVLHKKGKQWITISLAMLAMLGVGAGFTYTEAHADAVAPSKTAQPATNTIEKQAKTMLGNLQNNALKNESNAPVSSNTSKQNTPSVPSKSTNTKQAPKFNSAMQSYLNSPAGKAGTAILNKQVSQVEQQADANKSTNTLPIKNDNGKAMAFVQHKMLLDGGDPITLTGSTVQASDGHWIYYSSNGRYLSDNEVHDWQKGNSSSNLVYNYSPSTGAVEVTSGVLSDSNVKKVINNIKNNSTRVDAHSIKFDSDITVSTTSLNNMFYNNPSDLYSVDLDMDTSYVSDMSNMFYSSNSKSHLYSIVFGPKFNTSSVTNMSGMFEQQNALQPTLDVSSFNTSSVSDMENMFDDDASLISIKFSPSFDTGSVKNMSDMFAADKALTSLNLPSSFDTSSVSDMENMFQSDKALTSLNLPSSFNTSNVNFMDGMFESDYKLTSLDLGPSFNTSNVNDTSNMFASDRALTSLSLPSSFNTIRDSKMGGMFQSDIALTSLSLGPNFDTRNVGNTVHMFQNDTSLKSLNLGSKFDTSNIADTGYDHRTGLGEGSDSMMYDMFAGDSGSLNTLTIGSPNTKFYSDASVPVMYKETGRKDSHSLPLTVKGSADFSQGNNVGTFTVTPNVHGITPQGPGTPKQGEPIWDGMSYTYNKATGSLEFTGGTMTSANRFLVGSYGDNPFNSGLGAANNSTIKSIKFDDGISLAGISDLSSMFQSDYALQNVTLPSDWHYSQVSDMNSMFANDPALTTINFPSSSKFDTENVTDMSSMFSGDKALSSLNVQNWNTSKVTNMSSMFQSDAALSSLDLSSWNTHNVTNMNSMFRNAEGMYWNPGTHKLVYTGLTSITLPNDTSNVTDMGSMFSDDHKLTSLPNIENLNTSNVTNMSNMFSGDNSMSSFDLSKFDTHKVTNMSAMFNGDNLNSPSDITFGPKFNTSNVTDMSSMFDGAFNSSNKSDMTMPSLDTSHVTNMSGMFRDNQNVKTIRLPESFNTSNVNNMSYMFSNTLGDMGHPDLGHNSLKKLVLPSNFVINNGTNVTDMFDTDPMEVLIDPNISNLNTSAISPTTSNSKLLSTVKLNPKEVDFTVNFNGAGAHTPALITVPVYLYKTAGSASKWTVDDPQSTTVNVPIIPGYVSYDNDSHITFANTSNTVLGGNNIHGTVTPNISLTNPTAMSTTVNYMPDTKQVTYTINYQGAGAQTPRQYPEPITLKIGQGDTQWTVQGSDTITPPAISGYSVSPSSVTPSINLSNPQNGFTTVTYTPLPQASTNDNTQVTFTINYSDTPNLQHSDHETVYLTKPKSSSQWRVQGSDAFTLPSFPGYSPSSVENSANAVLKDNDGTYTITPKINLSAPQNSSDTVKYAEQKGHITVYAVSDASEVNHPEDEKQQYTVSDQVGNTFDLAQSNNSHLSRDFDYTLLSNPVNNFTNGSQTIYVLQSVDPNTSQGTLTVNYDKEGTSQVLRSVSSSYSYYDRNQLIPTSAINIPMNYKLPQDYNVPAYHYNNGSDTTITIPVSSIANQIQVEFVTPDNNGSITENGNKYSKIQNGNIANPVDLYDKNYPLPVLMPFDSSVINGHQSAMVNDLNSLLNGKYTLKTPYNFANSIVGNDIVPDKNDDGAMDTVYSSVALNPIKYTYTDTVRFVYSDMNGHQHVLLTDPTQNNTTSDIPDASNNSIYELINSIKPKPKGHEQPNSFNITQNPYTHFNSYILHITTGPDKGEYLLPATKDDSDASDQFEDNGEIMTDHTVSDVLATAESHVNNPTHSNYTQTIHVEKLGRIKVQLYNLSDHTVLKPVLNPAMVGRTDFHIDPSDSDVLSDVGIVGTSTDLRSYAADINSNLTPWTPTTPVKFITSDVTYNNTDLNYQDHKLNGNDLIFSPGDTENGAKYGSTFVYPDTYYPTIAQFGVASEQYFDKFIHIQYYNVDNNHVDQNLYIYGLYGKPFSLAPYYTSNIEHPGSSNMPIHDEYNGETKFYSRGKNGDSDLDDTITADSGVNPDTIIKKFNNDNHLIRIYVKSKNPSQRLIPSVIYADYNLYDPTKPENIGQKILYAGDRNGDSGDPFSDTVFEGSMPYLYFAYPNNNGHLMVASDVNSFGPKDHTIHILLTKRNTTITINYVDKNGHAVDSVNVTKPVIARVTDLDSSTPQFTPFTMKDIMNNLPYGYKFVSDETNPKVTHFTPSNQTVTVKVDVIPSDWEPSTPTKKSTTHVTPVVSGTKTNKHYPIQYGDGTSKNPDMVTYKGKQYPVHYHANGKNTVRVKVPVMNKHGKVVKKHGKPIYHYKNVVVSTNLPVPHTMSPSTVRAVDMVDFNNVAKHAWTAKGLDKALNTLSAGSVVSYHGTKYVQVPVPDHFRYFWVINDTLVHAYMSHIGNTHKFLKALKTHHLLTIYIKGIFAMHGKHANYLRYEISYKHHNYWVTARDDYVPNAYWQANDFKDHFTANHDWQIKVVHDCVMYKSAHYSHKTAIKPVHVGEVFHVKAVQFIGKKGTYQTRLLLTNGKYITANKNFVRIVK